MERADSETTLFLAMTVDDAVKVEDGAKALTDAAREARMTATVFIVKSK